MLKLLVVGHDQVRLNEIKEEIRPLQDQFDELRVSSARPGYLEAQMDSKLRLMIFDTRILNKMVFPFIVQIRKLGYRGPILMLGNPGSDFDMNELTRVHNLFHLHKPYDETQFLGLIKNCLDFEKVQQRRNPRFDVRERAVLEAYSSEFKTETVINNISRSGLRIEGNLSGLKQGDLLRLYFKFEKIKKERTMSARVVWVKKESDNKEEAGLEFVSQKAVYKYLLDYAVA